MSTTAGRKPIELRTPRERYRWWPRGPVGELVASGPVPLGPQDGRCRAPLALTDAGRALPRPSPVTALVRRNSWSFELR